MSAVKRKLIEAIGAPVAFTGAVPPPQNTIRIYTIRISNNQIIISNAKTSEQIQIGSEGHGAIDGPRATATFNQPKDLAADPMSGIVYVADTGNNKIRAILRDGSVTTFAGSGESGDADGDGDKAQFTTLYAIALDNDGQIFVWDNNKIRHISPATKSVSTIFEYSSTSRPEGRYLRVDTDGNLVFDGQKLTLRRNYTLSSSAAASASASPAAASLPVAPIASVVADPSSKFYQISSDRNVWYEIVENSDPHYTIWKYTQRLTPAVQVKGVTIDRKFKGEQVHFKNKADYETYIQHFQGVSTRPPQFATGANKGAAAPGAPDAPPGFKLQRINGNGNCLFAAIADQTLNETAETLRTKAMDEINTDNNETVATQQYAPFLIPIGTDDAMPIGAYTAKHGKNGIYGGEAELMALANVLGRSIHIWQFDGTNFVENTYIYNDTASGVPIYLMYYGELAYPHYNSLLKAQLITIYNWSRLTVNKEHGVGPGGTAMGINGPIYEPQYATNIIQTLAIAYRVWRPNHNIDVNGYTTVYITSDIHADVRKFLQMLAKESLIEVYGPKGAKITDTDSVFYGPNNTGKAIYENSLINNVRWNPEKKNVLVILVGDLVDGHRYSNVKDERGNFELLLHVLLYNLRVGAKGVGSELLFTIGNHDYNSVILDDKTDQMTEWRAAYVPPIVQKYFRTTLPNTWAANRRTALLPFYSLCPYFVLVLKNKEKKEIVCVHAGIHRLQDNKLESDFSEIENRQAAIDSAGLNQGLVNIPLFYGRPNGTTLDPGSNYPMGGPLWNRIYDRMREAPGATDLCNSIAPGDINMIVVGHCPTGDDGYARSIIQQNTDEKYNGCDGTEYGDDPAEYNKKGCVVPDCDIGLGPRIAFVDVGLSQAFRTNDNITRNAEFLLLKHVGSTADDQRFYNEIYRKPAGGDAIQVWPQTEGSGAGQPPPTGQPPPAGQTPTGQPPAAVTAGQPPPAAGQPPPQPLAAGQPPPTRQPPPTGQPPPAVQPPLAAGQPPPAVTAGQPPPTRQPPPAGQPPPAVQPPLAAGQPPPSGQAPNAVTAYTPGQSNAAAALFAAFVAVAPKTDLDMKRQALALLLGLTAITAKPNGTVRAFTPTGTLGRNTSRNTRTDSLRQGGLGGPGGQGGPGTQAAQAAPARPPVYSATYDPDRLPPEAAVLLRMGTRSPSPLTSDEPAVPVDQYVGIFVLWNNKLLIPAADADKITTKSFAPPQKMETADQIKEVTAYGNAWADPAPTIPSPTLLHSLKMEGRQTHYYYTMFDKQPTIHGTPPPTPEEAAAKIKAEAEAKVAAETKTEAKTEAKTEVKPEAKKPANPLTKSIKQGDWVWVDFKAYYEWMHEAQHEDDELEHNLYELAKKLGIPLPEYAPKWLDGLVTVPKECENSEYITTQCIAKPLRDRAISADRFARYSRISKADDPEAVLHDKMLRDATDQTKTQDERDKATRDYKERYYDKILTFEKMNGKEQFELAVKNPYAARKYREKDSTNFKNPTMTDEIAAANAAVIKNTIPVQLLASKPLIISILEGLWFCGNDHVISNSPQCPTARFLGELRLYKAAQLQQASANQAARVIKDDVWPLVTSYMTRVHKLLESVGFRPAAAAAAAGPQQKPAAAAAGPQQQPAEPTKPLNQEEAAAARASSHTKTLRPLLPLLPRRTLRGGAFVPPRASLMGLGVLPPIFPHG